MTGATVGVDLDARAYELDRAHVFHSWSAQGSLDPMVLSGGRGCRVWDHAGREYLDFASQMVNVNIGHQHPVVTAAIAEQAARLTTIGPAVANLQRGEAAQRITAHAPEGMNKVFFTNGGADANENAMRMARLHTGRDKVLSAYRSYHGNTGAAVVATGDWRRMPNEYARGHVHYFGPYLYRSEFWAETPEQESERALRHLERVVQAEGPQTIAAILVESVPGTAGILVPPPGYLAGVRAIADRYGIVLILDEVMCGFGRTGRWFAFDGYDVTPDLITFAKGVNSGYVPVGGIVISDEIAATFDDRVFPGGLTYSGHPLAAASIVAALDVMAEEGIVDNAERIGRTVIGPALDKLAAEHPIVGEVRGEGVFWAIELVADRTTREPVDAATIARVKAGLAARGVLVFGADNRIHFVPPCVVTEAEVAEAVAALSDVLADTLEIR
ncbi:aspartate aminotransferase family protein [Nocardia neocaledoniensis NBRC 108232]|uniref:Taurine--2-oxoglutarate transaminase n=1 Tax=Nocardia neocaledoniensis TaxID=236511 RepID=A0A317NNL1_9NOCA|nr:aspartate aminotransferase family protein [Nocardia neocaledoniensis]PWV76577.1 taurine--2-oxoglutarate transaminase [Nocardia neocaledoniensis]GEM30804.1 aspartate aminotransferase family protein [Nocardia neocaledoniensis NBRC 108232]